ncbi:MAG: tRNA (adenosine(37)-N6)-threonylcarbamoyltransferase complex transferase subunit TsaD [Candidatus Doudnabacteria bacterium]|nr:tRNA (adenosine(37)-N6)-threonylcarbamoyltransferase complex transferase subunit TsaD [Candidatus Doudnabacteria bacterium]
MNILAIETSCDETAAAVITDGKIRSSIIASQADLHAKFGGVVPEVAAREHVTAIIPAIDLALKKAKLKLNDIDEIAVTQGPGLITSLLVGIETAQALGAALGIPVLPINHREAHISANSVREKSGGKPKRNQKAVPFSLPPLPALVLIVSGGHTMLVLMKKHGDYKILGETVDDAAGEAFDKTAKLLGLGYPGGPALSKLAETGNPGAFDFPRPMIHSKDYNFSFSGLKTSVLYTVNELKSLNLKLKSNLAASIQAAIIESLVAKTEKAIVQYKPKTLMLGGGVAANQELRKQIKLLATTYHLQPSIPAFEYCTDNAAMIGLAAYYKIQSGKANYPKSFRADSNLELK